MSKVVTIKNDNLSIDIENLGAQMKSIKGSNGTEYLWQGDENVWAGRAPVLFPICGGLKDDKYIFEGKEYILNKHGYARFKEFTLEKSDENSAVFLHKSDKETKKSYPFDYEFRIIYTLDGNKITVTYETKNVSDKTTMYFSVGAHEGYSCPEGIEEYEIVFDKPETLDSYVLDGNLLEENTVRVMENSTVFPLKCEYFSVDALVFRNLNSRKVQLRNKNGDRKIDVEFNGSDYLLFWTKPNGIGKYICIEPWCGIQDGVDSDYDFVNKEGIISLKPFDTHSVSHTITIEV